MKYTHENTKELLTHIQELNKLANEYYKDKGLDKYNYYEPRINWETGNLEHEVNTACNCHPEYEWKSFCDFDTFIEWVIKKQNKQTE